MEGFPDDYVAHNIPFILLSGLGQDESTTLVQTERSRKLLQDGGFRIRTDLPNLTGPAVENLLQAFLAYDSGDDGLSSKNISARGSPGAFKIKRIGRAYALPPRKASPPPHAPRLGPLPDGGSPPPPPLTLHSTISPLTPSSPLFPDGIFTPLWITKHRSRLPALFVSFFALTTDPNTSSLGDNQIKTEIGNIRNIFSSASYKSKVVVVLVADPGADTPHALDERLGSIRKAAGLDAKHLFFHALEDSKEAADGFARSILTSLRPFCVEYYRDLSKHTRRKRNRTTVPPPTAPPTHGTSQTLSLQGWNVRYEFKLGVFAEFRQEMDAACRSYESAYDGLFSPELFETISSWSPRFNEARLLADAIGIRILRCLLWTGQPVTAVRFWTTHRHRAKDLVDRKGKGSANYGWEAWEAAWAKSFAGLLASLKESATSASDSLWGAGQQYSRPEKSIAIGERITPWQLLHHDGYWWQRAWRHTQRRRDLAYQLSEEDRTSPGQSPASAIASRSHLYDTYLALEPHLEYPAGDRKGYDHSHEILKTLQATRWSFSKYDQIRQVERLRLEEAKEHLQRERWHDALLTMRSIWPFLSWKQAGWWLMVAEAAEVFIQAAIRANDSESLLRLTWEAHCSAIPMNPQWVYSLQGCLQGVEVLDRKKPTVELQSDDSLSPIWAALHFASAVGNVGEPQRAQLVLTSTAHKGSELIQLSEINVLFEGLRPLRLIADDSEESPQEACLRLLEVRLRDQPISTDNQPSTLPTSNSNSLTGLADIVMHPSQTKVFDITCVPREAGEVKVASINLLCEGDSFSLTYAIRQQTILKASWWYLRNGNPQSRPLGRDDDVSRVNIFPKPPKLRLDLPNLRPMYYTNEKVSLSIVIKNMEVEAAEVSVDARLLSPLRHTVMIKWQDMAGPDSFPSHSKEEDLPAQEHLSLPRRSVGRILNDSSHHLTFVMDRTLDAMECQLELTAHYHLLSDPETWLSKITTVNLPISRPFEANYELLPRLDAQPWPSFFDPLATADGILQRFSLVSKIACFVTEPVPIEHVSVISQNVVGNAVCDIGEERPAEPVPESLEAAAGNDSIASEGVRESSFDVLVQKLGLGDGRSVALDLGLRIHWRRIPEEEVIISTLEVPRFVLPMSEPRVLLSKREDTIDKQAGIAYLQYVIENPSLHYLTFNLAMESSEEFAFSGAKATNFSLVPVSRHSVQYRLIAHQASRWVRVNLAVTDAYFSKSLRVSPAGPGVKSDGKRGLLVWVE